MASLSINLFDQRDRGRLDPDEAVVRLQQQFPEAIVLLGDRLIWTARWAEQHLDLTDASARAVVEKLCWNAQHLGPAYAFYIPEGPGPQIDGVLKRYEANFDAGAPLAERMRARIIAFLRSLIPPGLAIDVREECDKIVTSFQRQDLRAEWEAMGQTIAESLIINGKHELLLHIIQTKFGAVPDDLKTWLSGVGDPAALEQLADNILRAETVEQLQTYRTQSAPRKRRRRGG